MSGWTAFEPTRKIDITVAAVRLARACAKKEPSA